MSSGESGAEDSQTNVNVKKKCYYVTNSGQVGLLCKATPHKYCCHQRKAAI